MNRRIGVIGAGLMGLTHVRLLSGAVSGGEVVAVADAVPEAAERAAAEAAIEAAHDDALALIGDERVEAVVVASPAGTHEAFVLACIQAGKPVLCEKPLAETVDAARRVLDAEVASGRRLVQVGFMRRFDPGYADMKTKLAAGLIGRPLLVHCAHRNPTVPPAFGSEMIVTETVVHEMDTIRWLLDQEIVRATVLTPRPSGHAAEGVQDPQLVIFETQDGALADVEAFVNAQYAYDIRCEVVGELGTISLPASTPVLVRRESRDAAELPMRFQERFGAAYVNELQAWVAGLTQGRAVGPSAWDGYAAAAVSEATVEALRSGSPVDVTLDARPDLYAPDTQLIGKR
jgi:myo-inositol 2-dehydrogenase / D-chiro-inositol 1-dehydrogenase